MPHRPAPIRPRPLFVCLLIGAGALSSVLVASTSFAADESRYYRCGPKGQDLRDTPCPPGAAGSALALPQDNVTPDQQKAARERAAREAKDAETMRREREQLESRRTPAATGIRDGIDARTHSASRAAGPSTGAQDPKKRKPKDASPKPKKPPTIPQPQKPPTTPQTLGAHG